MTWLPRAPLALAGLAFVVLALATASAAAGSLLVMSSTDPAIAPGTMVDEAAPLAVADGAEVALLHEDGSIATIAGPHDGPPPAIQGEAAPNLIAALSTLVGEGGVDTSDFGSVRGAAEDAENPWAIDLTVSGHRCAMAGGRPLIWRPEGVAGALGQLSGGSAVRVGWPAEGGVQPWPDGLPVKDYTDYGFVPDGSGSAAHIVLHVVPAGMPTAAHVAKWMAESGCTPQARRLLRAAIAATAGDALKIALDTPRGPVPVYALGDELALELDLSADAYVECLYQSADGTTVRLLPNSMTGGPRLAGPFVHTIPRAGDRLSITTSGVGTERVRCFAWRTDPYAALPDDLRDADITAPLARPLDALAADITASSMPPEAETSLVIEVRG